MITTETTNDIYEKQVGVLYTDNEIEDILYEDNDSITDSEAQDVAVDRALASADLAFRETLKEVYRVASEERFDVR